MQHAVLVKGPVIDLDEPGQISAAKALLFIFRIGLLFVLLLSDLANSL